jgi:hypothetical protein
VKAGNRGACHNIIVHSPFDTASAYTLPFWASTKNKNYTFHTDGKRLYCYGASVAALAWLDFECIPVSEPALGANTTCGRSDTTPRWLARLDLALSGAIGPNRCDAKGGSQSQISST